MTEEETVEQNVEQETVTTTERYSSIYASESAINQLTKFIGDTPSDDLMDTVMKNADSTVNSRLARHSLPTYTHDNIDDETTYIPEVLCTAANYYAVSDLLQAVYGKDDRSTNEQGFYTKAENLLNDYIEQQLVELAETTLQEQSPYGYSQSKDAFDLGLIHK